MGELVSRVTTFRCPVDLLDDIEAVARIDGLAVAEVLRIAAQEYVARRQAQRQFKERLRERIEADQRILRRLAGDDPAAREDNGGAGDA